MNLTRILAAGNIILLLFIVADSFFIAPEIIRQHFATEAWYLTRSSPTRSHETKELITVEGEHVQIPIHFSTFLKYQEPLQIGKTGMLHRNLFVRYLVAGGEATLFVGLLNDDQWPLKIIYGLCLVLSVLCLLPRKIIALNPMYLYVASVVVWLVTWVFYFIYY
jgi:hypothetical protein